ncbi:hypothetical protein GCM10010253_48000 [Streptomyces badius]|uniref:Uncharacterized protein n=2 Tax=Streptomyces badius TaxID=1941 RepID=A0ABQ2THH6_STRBA|nr:hypothetical protein GCM10010253_48000 [Streptomyces badius]
MLVQVEAVRWGSDGTATVRTRSGVGSAVARWRGDPTEAGCEHHVEWSVDEYVVWGGNTRPAADPSPMVGEDGDRITFRGRLSLTGDGGAVLEVADAQILFDLADPPPPMTVKETWVEISVERNRVSLFPSLL